MSASRKAKNRQSNRPGRGGGNKQETYDISYFDQTEIPEIAEMTAQRICAMVQAMAVYAGQDTDNLKTFIHHKTLVAQLLDGSIRLPNGYQLNNNQKARLNAIMERCDALALKKIEDAKRPREQQSDNKLNKAKESEKNDREVEATKHAPKDAQATEEAAAAKEAAQKTIKMTFPSVKLSTVEKLPDGLEWLVRNDSTKQIFDIIDKLTNGATKDMDKLVFSRPSIMGKAKDMAKYGIVLTRTNEWYSDTKAAMVSERGYVRTLALHANSIAMVECWGKHPLLVMTDIEEEPITCTGNAVDAASDRMLHLTPTGTPKQAHEVTSQATHVKFTSSRVICRILLKEGQVDGFKKTATVEQHASYKEQRFQFAGHTQVSINLTLPEVEMYKKRYPIEFLSNITSSANGKRQFTLRAKGHITLETLIHKALAMQKLYGATVHINGANSIRVTLPEDFTTEKEQEIRKNNPDWKVFADVPLDTFAPGRAQPMAPRKPAPEGKKLVQMVAAGASQPDIAEAVAQSFGGTIHDEFPSKFTETTVKYRVAVPADFDVAAHSVPYYVTRDLAYMVMDLGISV